MKIRLMLSLLLILLLICIVLNASDQTFQDSLKTSEPDSIQQIKKDSSWSKNFLNWIESPEGLIEFLGLMVAVLTALCALIAWIIKLRRKLKQAEIDRAKLIAEHQARLEASALHKAKEKQKKLETEEDRYLDFIITKNEKLTFQGFETAVKTPILL